MTQATLDLHADVVDSAYYKLMTAPLPEKTGRYTPIAHSRVIGYITEMLDKQGFTVKKSIYRSAVDGLIGQGEYHIEYGGDAEMGLMLAWQNSYNKQVSFKYAIGAHVFVCSNGVVCGDLASYKRRHTGTADSDALEYIETYIKQAKEIFARLVYDREELKKHTLGWKDVAEMVGRMYLYDQVITSTQLNIMKREMDNPTYSYGVEPMNAWSIYNYATHAFKEDSPRNWINRHIDLHNFFSKEFNLDTYKQPETPVVEKKIIIPTPMDISLPTETTGTVDDLLSMF